MTDANSVFYSAEKINKTLLNKARKSFYEKDKVFYKFHARIEDENVLDDDKVKIPFYTPFLEQKGDIGRSSALCSIKKPFELVHVDVANIWVFFQTLQSIQAIVYYVLIFFHRKFMFTQ